MVMPVRVYGSPWGVVDGNFSIYGGEGVYIYIYALRIRGPHYGLVRISKVGPHCPAFRIILSRCWILNSSDVFDFVLTRM